MEVEVEEEQEDAGGCWYHEYFVMTLQAGASVPHGTCGPNSQSSSNSDVYCLILSKVILIAIY